jgi:hypothetical protein
MGGVFESCPRRFPFAEFYSGHFMNAPSDAVTAPGVTPSEFSHKITRGASQEKSGY